MKNTSEAYHLNRYQSRKWIALKLQLFFMISVPVLYKMIGIHDYITISVIGAIATGSAAYTGFNVLQKKFSNPPPIINELIGGINGSE